MKAWINDASKNKFFRLTLIVAMGSIVLDQASKLWILHGLDLDTVRHIDLSAIFDLTYVENRGVSFGLFSGGMVSRVLLTLLALGVSGYILHWAGRLIRPIAAVGAGFIVGGAVGNAIDRIFYGYVVDFLDFSGLWFPWQFNIADVCINIGVACLAYDAFFVAPKQAAASSAPPDTTSTTLSDGDETERPPANRNLTESKDN